MANKKIDINLEVMDFFKGKYPDLEIKTPKMASLGVTEEFRRLEVGEIVLFPVGPYNYQTIRSTPGSTMIPEVLNEGRQWKTRIDKANKCIAVLRTA